MPIATTGSYHPQRGQEPGRWRGLGRTVISLFSSFLGSLIFIFFTTGHTYIESNTDFLILSLIGIFGGTAAILFIYSYRLIAASKIAVFEYLAIPSSFILAWIFFGEAPFDQLFPGVLLIVFAGMIIIWRDKNKKINKPN